MTMIKTIAATAIMTFSMLSAGPANAVIFINGVSFNGATLNSMQLNRVVLNGNQFNHLGLNGMRVQGQDMNHRSSQGQKFNAPAIMAPDGGFAGTIKAIGGRLVIEPSR